MAKKVKCHFATGFSQIFVLIIRNDILISLNLLSRSIGLKKQDFGRTVIKGWPRK